jgi:hypothetical protein
MTARRPGLRDHHLVRHDPPYLTIGQDHQSSAGIDSTNWRESQVFDRVQSYCPILIGFKRNINPIPVHDKIPISAEVTHIPPKP